MAQSSNVVFAWAIEEPPAEIFAIPARPALAMIHLDVMPFGPASVAVRMARRDRINTVLRSQADSDRGSSSSKCDPTPAGLSTAGQMRWARRVLLRLANLAAWATLDAILVLIRWEL